MVKYAIVSIKIYIIINSNVKETEKDFVEYLTEIGQTDFANQMCNYRRNIIQIHLDKGIPNIPVGKSKYGGYPDLPPEIPYPTMSGYTEKRGKQKKRYEACAMQLVLQIHLADLAAYDTENLLPHTGMLYFFWSGPKSCRFSKGDMV